MSCSGCRVLRKGCSDVCVLRPSICWIDGSKAQGHATVFVAKFFGRAGLLSSLSSVPESHRPGMPIGSYVKSYQNNSHVKSVLTPSTSEGSLAVGLNPSDTPDMKTLFRSLLHEACGRMVNPVTGAVGLLWSSNWDACEAAVETVLRGGIPRPMVQLGSDAEGLYELDAYPRSSKKRQPSQESSCDLDLCLTWRSPVNDDGRVMKRRATLSDESVMTSAESGGDQLAKEQPQILDLFV